MNNDVAVELAESMGKLQTVKQFVNDLHKIVDKNQRIELVNIIKSMLKLIGEMLLNVVDYAEGIRSRTG